MKEKFLQRLTIISHFAVFLLLMTSCTGTPPGEAQTDGVRQFLGDGFSFKYPQNASLDIQGERDGVLRTFTISGETVRFSAEAGSSFEMPSFEYFIEIYENPSSLDSRAFAEDFIIRGYNDAVESGSPAGYWPVQLQDDEMLVEGRNVRIRGNGAFETIFFTGDSETVRSFLSFGNRAMAIGYRSYPIENNPAAPAWEAVYNLALDTIRID
ncbi:MAG: hypothetical protein LAT67_08320 [Balneolales bacterium]|nr:hypothetical protein [Balneolales bacterium]